MFNNNTKNSVAKKKVAKKIKSAHALSLFVWEHVWFCCLFHIVFSNFSNFVVALQRKIMNNTNW